MFIHYASSDPMFYFSWVFLAAFSICCHEYAHAATALRVGDDTAAREGHLTLNPLVQMGLGSMIMLVLFGMAWGAVPVGLSRVRKPRDRAMIAAAGPLTNLLLCLFFALLLAIAQVSGFDVATRFLTIGGSVNGMLFVLNMLPVPVLDGFAIISAFHSKIEDFAQKYATPVFFIFILLLWNTPIGSLIFGMGRAIQSLFTLFFLSLFSFVS